MTKRKTHTPEFKAKVALEAIREAMTLADHDIQVAFLVFRPTSYMRTFQENSDWGGCRVSIRVSLTFFVEADLVGNAASIETCVA